MKSKQDWSKYGEMDPYYGVLSDNKYKKDNLTESGFSEFFETGNQYVRETQSRIYQQYADSIAEMDILDFGCGVGRLAIPFAQNTVKKVVGLDVSPGMISIAQAKQKQLELNNLQYVSYSGENIPNIGPFDLVNSYIVIQHIEPEFGYPLIEQLCEQAKVGGYVHLQIPYGHQLPLISYLKFYLKVNNDFYNKFSNWAKGEGFQRTPVMQMNYYKQEKLEEIFSKYTDKVHKEPTDHGGHLGNFYYFKRTK
jgi:SAM-dependent methyltransferase